MPNAAFNTDTLTTNTGAPIVSNEFSLRAGNRGAITNLAPTYSQCLTAFFVAHTSHLNHLHIQALCSWRTTTCWRRLDR